MDNPGNDNPIDPCDCFSVNQHNAMQRLINMVNKKNLS